MYQVEVSDEFSAAHFLKLYDGSLEPRHGHNWKVVVRIEAEKLDSMGVVVDFEALKPTLKKILSELNQTVFNERPEFKNNRQNPSTENIARFIYSRLSNCFQSDSARIARVTVWETPDASASYVA